jgi:hypothetical protein
MTVQQISEQAPGGDPEVVADLQRKIADLTEEGDRLAGVRSDALKESDRQQRIAEQCMQHVLTIRDRVERWRRHLELEQNAPSDIPGEPVDDQGNVQTVLFPRAIYPLAHSSEGRIFLTCTRCGRPTREATQEEVREVEAGLAVRHECGDCHPQTGPRTHPYPPVTPDDAA